MSLHHWTEDNIPALAGKKAIVTGSTSGLGLETARILSRRGAAVCLAVRDVSRGERVADSIRNAVPSADISVGKLDLASLASIENFATSVCDESDRLDILINNAGVMVPPLGHTEDGFELQMGTNHFGHFALTGRLMGLLMATADSRIAVTSSIAHRQGKPDLHDIDWKRRKYSAWQAYGDSKIANLLFAYELVRRLDGKGPMVVAGHPGWTRTSLQRHSGIAGILNPIMGMPLEQGVLGPVRAATDPDAQSGDFFGPKGWFGMRGYPERVEPTAMARSARLARDLWELSEKRTGVTFNLEASA
ncbi:oxidoreductase [uncultured Cohaesibacter sp.]|uniref:oxidoreductase n=1 Tax=uncultured Cohaesibacter sp. TaxID=1002546 RepID=UPI0029C76264|nr:oxidoreductase [uncultured Cohaesibacter sp.]